MVLLGWAILKPIGKITIAERVAQQLREGIAAGTLVGVLPGIRELSKVLGVSPSSVMQGLALLLEQGVIAKSGRCKAYEVREGSDDRSTGTSKKKLWIVEPLENPQPSALQVPMLRSLESRLSRIGWSYEWSMEILDQTRSHRKHWNQLLKAREPDAILIVGPHRSTAIWAAECGLPVCCLGGDVTGLNLTSVGFDSRAMIRMAIEHLFDLGHRDVFLPLTVRTPVFCEKVHETLNKILSEKGIVFSPQWHSPVTLRYTPQALLELLEKRFEQKPPTALLGFGSSVLTMMGFLLRQGMRVPRDLSLVCLGGEHEIQWVRPEIAHFDFDWLPRVRFVERWLKSGPLPPDQRLTLLVPSWIEGETIGPVRGGKVASVQQDEEVPSGRSLAGGSFQGSGRRRSAE